MPDRNVARKVLILGGTSEARQLAGQLVAGETGLRNLEVITSLAGRTHQPVALPGRVRIGGFGGAGGLAAFLVAESVDLLIDATHPFAVQISANAASASAMTGVPRLALMRPEWHQQAGDRWTEVANMREAAARLAVHGRRAFLATGRRDLGVFAGLESVWFLVRLVDVPDTPLPLPDYRLITGRGPFAVADERRLFEAHAIDVLVCKASGGAATVAKLTAARNLGLPVVMVRRPPLPAGPLARGVEHVISNIRTILDAPANEHDTHQL